MEVGEGEVRVQWWGLGKARWQAVGGMRCWKPRPTLPAAACMRMRACRVGAAQTCVAWLWFLPPTITASSSSRHLTPARMGE